MDQHSQNIEFNVDHDLKCRTKIEDALIKC